MKLEDIQRLLGGQQYEGKVLDTRDLSPEQLEHKAKLKAIAAQLDELKLDLDTVKKKLFESIAKDFGYPSLENLHETGRVLKLKPETQVELRDTSAEESAEVEIDRSDLNEAELAIIAEMDAKQTLINSSHDQMRAWAEKGKAIGERFWNTVAQRHGFESNEKATEAGYKWRLSQDSKQIIRLK